MKFSEHYWRYRREPPDRARITLPMCERAVTEAVEMEEQPDGRIVYWHYVEDEGRYLKVVVEPGGEEIVTAHFGRGFGRRAERRQG